MPENFEIQFKKSARKELLAVPKPNLKRLIDKLAALAVDPQPADSTKLVGLPSRRLRQGDWRVIYEVDEAAHIVVIQKFAHRREVYR